MRVVIADEETAKMGCERHARTRQSAASVSLSLSLKRKHLLCVDSLGGFLLVLDGTSDASRRAKQMLHWDVFNGVSRRAWGGNENAVDYTLSEEELNNRYDVVFPHKVSDEDLDASLAAMGMGRGKKEAPKLEKYELSILRNRTFS